MSCEDAVNKSDCRKCVDSQNFEAAKEKEACLGQSSLLCLLYSFETKRQITKINREARHVWGGQPDPDGRKEKGLPRRCHQLSDARLQRTGQDHSSLGF